MNSIRAHPPQALRASPAACFATLAALGTAESESEAKAQALLKEWLSPEQLAEYERGASFDVMGSKTGKRYRIEKRRQQNVFELDRKGRPIRGWCFMPEGCLAMGDVMLAQKIALETDEEEVMNVALPFRAEAWLGGLVRWVIVLWRAARPLTARTRLQVSGSPIDHSCGSATSE